MKVLLIDGPFDGDVISVNPSMTGTTLKYVLWHPDGSQYMATYEITERIDGSSGLAYWEGQT